MKLLELMDLQFLTAVVSVAVTVLSFIAKSFSDTRRIQEETKEIKEEVNRTLESIESLEKTEGDVLVLMIRNVAELREYYVINKQQARKSFSAALFVSFLGFLLFAGGVGISYLTKDPQIPLYSTAGGAIVEIIAGLFFWLYKKAISQINIFHKSLLKTEKFLTAIQLVEKISPANRDKTYEFIISQIITNGTIVENETEE